MASQCLHGFVPEHCAACRTCPHGMMTSRCGRCADPLATRAAAKILPDAQAPIEHRGHEIFFVPADRSWYYREPDGDPSTVSFSSAFRARRGLDEALDHPAPAPTSGKKRK